MRAGYGAVQVTELTREGGLLLAAAGGGRCCGYLAITAAAGGGDACDVYLCNYASTISIAAMTLGQSSKRDQDSLAGFFGEVRAGRRRRVPQGYHVHAFPPGT